MCGLVRYGDAKPTVSAASSKLNRATCANLHVEMTSSTLTRRYELTVHETVDIKEFR
jgi:hypothetical protein